MTSNSSRAGPVDHSPRFPDQLYRASAMRLKKLRCIIFRVSGPAARGGPGRWRRSLGVTFAFLAGGMHAQLPGAPAGVTAFKRMTLQELLDVEVTSVSRRPEKISESASAVQIVTAEDLRRAGVRTIPEALRLLPNLQVAQVDARQWAITSRGFNATIANKHLVLLDGRTLYTPLFAGVFWDVQDTFLPDIDRIEVISGPGATQWGSNAVNGVINITTKPARETQGGMFIAGTGSQLHGFGSVRYGGALSPTLHYRVYGKVLDFGNSRLPAGGDAGDSWHREQGGFRLDWAPQTSDQLTLQGDLYSGRIGQLAARDIKVTGGNLLGRWTRTMSSESELQVKALYDYTFRRVPGSITEDLDAFELDLVHRFRASGRQEFVWGATYRIIHDKLRNPPAFAFLPPKVTREWWSGFVQDRITLRPETLDLLLGVKVEQNPYTNVEYQPSARLGWKFSPRHFLWGAVSRAVRTPSRIDRDFFRPAVPPYQIAGGPDFRSEELLAYELGYRGEISPKLGASLATFLHDYSELRSLEPASGISASVLANGLEGRSYGAELSLDYRATPVWRIRLGYTEMRVSAWPDAQSDDRALAGSPPADPDRQFLLHSQYDVSDAFHFDAVLRRVARITLHQVPAYTELDLRASWRPHPKLELALVGRNLLDAQHPEFNPVATRREVRRSLFVEGAWTF